MSSKIGEGARDTAPCVTWSTENSTFERKLTRFFDEIFDWNAVFAGGCASKKSFFPLTHVKKCIHTDVRENKYRYVIVKAAKRVPIPERIGI